MALQHDALALKVLGAFFGYSHERVERVSNEKLQLAHYTTADTAMKIIKGRTIWLRNAAVMNDHSEIEYGRKVMEPVLKSPLGVRFYDVLDAAHAGASQEVMRQHVEHRRDAREKVFMSSLSEHVQGDRLGRLSMWRAYGGPVAGIALLLKSDIVQFDYGPVDLETVFSPVFLWG